MSNERVYMFLTSFLLCLEFKPFKKPWRIYLSISDNSTKLVITQSAFLYDV